MKLDECTEKKIVSAKEAIYSGDYGKAQSVLSSILLEHQASGCVHRIEDGCRNPANKVGLCHPSNCPEQGTVLEWARRRFPSKTIPVANLQVKNGLLRKIVT